MNLDTVLEIKAPLEGFEEPPSHLLLQRSFQTLIFLKRKWQLIGTRNKNSSENRNGKKMFLCLCFACLSLSVCLSVCLSLLLSFSFSLCLSVTLHIILSLCVSLPLSWDPSASLCLTHSHSSTPLSRSRSLTLPTPPLPPPQTSPHLLPFFSDYHRLGKCEDIDLMKLEAWNSFIFPHDPQVSWSNGVIFGCEAQKSNNTVALEPLFCISDWRWGTADAEVKVSSLPCWHPRAVSNVLFVKACRRLAYSFSCFPCCQGLVFVSFNFISLPHLPSPILLQIVKGIVVEKENAILLQVEKDILLQIEKDILLQIEKDILLQVVS